MAPDTGAAYSRPPDTSSLMDWFRSVYFGGSCGRAYRSSGEAAGLKEQPVSARQADSRPAAAICFQNALMGASSPGCSGSDAAAAAAPRHVFNSDMIPRFFPFG